MAAETDGLWSLFCHQRGASGAEYLSESPHRVALRFFFDDLEPSVVEGWGELFRAEYPAAEPPVEITARQLPGEDWQESWRLHFRPTPVGVRLLVCPPWDARGDGERWPGRLPLIIDPGRGFGTGSHASTALALTLLEALLEALPAGIGKPGRMLDVGVGSGILAIAARLLGVKESWGLDIDGGVMNEVRRNYRLNGLGERVTLIQGRPGCLKGTFDIVTANLTREALLIHRDDLAGLTAPGGALILSGLLHGEWKEVAEAFEKKGLRQIDAAHLEEWSACLMTPAG